MRLRYKEDIAKLERRVAELTEENESLTKALERYSDELRKTDLEKEFGDLVLIHVCDFVQSLAMVRSERHAYTAVKGFIEKVSLIMVRYGEKFKELRNLTSKLPQPNK